MVYWFAVTMFWVVIVLMVVGIFKPHLVIRWGNREQVSSKKAVLTYGLMAFLFFIIANIAENATFPPKFLTSLTNDNKVEEVDEDERDDNRQSSSFLDTERFKEEESILDETVEDYMKGDKYDLAVHRTEDGLKVVADFEAVNDEFVLFLDVPKHAFRVLNLWQVGHPDLFNEFVEYDLTFYHDGKVIASTVYDNSAGVEVKDMDLYNPITKEELPFVNLKRWSDTATDEEKAAFDAQYEQEKEERRESEYQTGITIEEILRGNINDYEGSKVKYTGEILQQVDVEYLTAYLMKVNEGSTVRIVMIFVTPRTMALEEEVRFLEGDNVTIYGKVVDMIDYTTVSRTKNTVPGLEVMYYQIH